jgi:hypothetical protein
MVPEDRTERAGEFADALGRLRRDGGALLVVGATPGETHCRACDRMLGSSEQRRVVCRTDRTCTAGPRADGTDERVVDLAVPSRSAAAADATGEPAGEAPDGPAAGATSTTPPAETVPAFGERVANAVAAATADASDPRVCVDSLLPVVDMAGAEAAFQWCHAVASDVRAAGGVCHTHLPVPREHDLVGRLESLVDATVELRLADGAPEQRWFVHGSVTSDWLPLQE